MAETDSTYSFGYWVKKRRLSLDLTQKRLAGRVGCATVTLKKIEADERRPSREIAARLAECLDIPAQFHTTFVLCARGQMPIDKLPVLERPASGEEQRDAAPSPPAFLREAEEISTTDRSPFVAGERELAQLNLHLDEVLNGNGRTVFVTGEAGSGKTTLMAEFARRSQMTHDELIVVTGHCHALTGAGDPYLPFRDVIGMLTGDVESKWAAGEITTRHARRLWNGVPLATQMLVEEGPDLIDVFVSGAALTRRVAATVPEGADYLRRLKHITEWGRATPGDLEQSHLFEQFTQVLRTLAARQPLLITLDDLQWADSASINLLFHLGMRLSRSPILILGAFRSSDVFLGPPSGDAAGGRQHPIVAVVNEFKRRYGDIEASLERFRPEEGRRFIDDLLDTEPNRFGEGFRATLFKRTKGHPLFTIELLRLFQQQGDLVRDEHGRWIESGALNWKAMPARVEAVIEQRVGRLDDELRDILTVASVEGENFTAQVIAHVQKISEWSLIHRLSQELEGQHLLVRERGEHEVGQYLLSHYRFSHALFQQFLYERLGSAERRLLHHEVALALEELYEGHIDEVAAQLAYHYVESRERKKAIAYARRAARRAEAMYAYDEALKHLQTALDLIETEEELELHMALLEQLADVVGLLGEDAQSIELYLEALESWRQQSGADNMIAVRLNNKIGNKVLAMRRFADRERFNGLARSSLETGLQLIEEEPPHRETVRLLATLSSHAWRIQVPADWDAAESYAQSAVSMAETLDSPAELSSALDALANVYGGRGLYRERVLVSRRRLALGRDPRFGDDPHERGQILLQAGAAMMQVGDYAEAITHLLEAERTSSQVQALEQQVRALMYRSRCYFQLDRWDEVLEIEERLRSLERRYPKLPERAGAKGPTCLPIALSASVHALRGQFDRATTLQRESLTIMTAIAGSMDHWRRSHHY